MQLGNACPKLADFAPTNWEALKKHLKNLRPREDAPWCLMQVSDGPNDNVLCKYTGGDGEEIY